MEGRSRLPTLSLVVPGSTKNGTQDTTAQRTSQIPSRSNGIAPAKQKRLFPVACRLVPMDQWFTTRIDRTWNVLDLKIWLLSKALPTPVLPLPASYRPSSPVTFAAAPAQSPRPATASSYHAPAAATDASSSTTLAPSHPSISPISPITFAAAPDPPSHRAKRTSYESPQTPGRHIFYPPLSSAPATSSPASSTRFSIDEDDEDVPLYANSYTTMLDSHFEDEEDEDEDEDDTQVTGITPRSIPYSYSTGAPAISGLAALKSNSKKIISARGYSGGPSSGDLDLARQATAIAKRWHVFSFSTGMLLSDDLPLTEYTIRPYELLEVHRAGAYVPLPQTILPGLDPSSSREDSEPRPTATKTTCAYPSSTTRNFYAPYPIRQESPSRAYTDARVSTSSESSDDEYDHMAVGSPYAQPYFDGWVFVLRDGGLGASGGSEAGNNDGGDGDAQPGRKMRRRRRAKSDTNKSGRGRDRARLDRDMKQPSRKEDDAEVQVQENCDLWNKRWMIIREGYMTFWKERREGIPEDRYRLSSCVALYGADRLPSVLSASSPTRKPFSTPLAANVIPPHSSTSTSKAAQPSSYHVICARFRQPSSSRGMQAGKPEGKSSGKSQLHNGALVVLKVADASIHEHLLRIFHRLCYSSPISPSKHRSTSSSSVAPSHTPHTRTLRTDFLPNPIPHPLSLSFSAPSPIEQGDESPGSPSHHWERSDGSEYDDDWADTGSTWGRPRRNAVGKVVTGSFGLGRGVGIRYPEWREEIIRKAIYAGRGLTVPESRRALDSSPEAGTPRTDQLHIYGFVREDLDHYAANLTRAGYDSDNSDSDVFSEADWDGWAYDLDRPKTADETGTAQDRSRKRRNGLTTPQASPVSDPELPPIPGPPSDGASSPSTSTLRPRARSLSTSSPVLATTSNNPPSPTSTPPVTPGGRTRSSTFSAHLGSTSTIVDPTSVGPSNSATSSSQMDNGIRSDSTIPSLNAVGGVRNLIRGLSVRAGKESFLRGLENALDFVEGK